MPMGPNRRSSAASRSSAAETAGGDGSVDMVRIPQQMVTEQKDALFRESPDCFSKGGITRQGGSREPPPCLRFRNLSAANLRCAADQRPFPDRTPVAGLPVSVVG